MHHAEKTVCLTPSFNTWDGAINLSVKVPTCTTNVIEIMLGQQREPSGNTDLAEWDSKEEFQVTFVL